MLTIENLMNSNHKYLIIKSKCDNLLRQKNVSHYAMLYGNTYSEEALFVLYFKYYMTVSGLPGFLSYKSDRVIF